MTPNPYQSPAAADEEPVTIPRGWLDPLLFAAVYGSLSILQDFWPLLWQVVTGQ